MAQEIVARPGRPSISVSVREGLRAPAIIEAAGEKATRRFFEFFIANIRNPNTRRAYAHAIGRFMEWCAQKGIPLERLEPMLVAAYVEQLQTEIAAPSVKLHLAAIRMLFDYLVVGQVMPFNPASAVRGPRHVVKIGKTPALTAEEARDLLSGIETDTLLGLRDRAMFAVMTYSFARIGAVVQMRVKDYYTQGRRTWFRLLHEKGGKFHVVPAHHKAVEFVDEYIAAAGIGDQPNSPLFRSSWKRTGELTAEGLTTNGALRVVKRRALAAGLPSEICNHTFRATGITAFLANGGELSKAQKIAGHESPRTTSLYDRTKEELSLDEIERILI
jgi:integrase/recombinase XerD